MVSSGRYAMYRLMVVRDKAAPSVPRETIAGPDDAIRFAERAVLGASDREHMVVISLDARNQPTGWNLVSTGSLAASIVHPREVFKWLILSNAAAGLLLHNHPSGDPDPSEDDRRLWERMHTAGELLGIEIYDSIVIGEREYVCLRDGGRHPLRKETQP